MKPLLVLFGLWQGVAHGNDSSTTEDPSPSVGHALLDVKQPVRVDIDGSTVGQFYNACQVRIELEEGEHALRVHLNGAATEYPLTVNGKRTTHVLIDEGGVFMPKRDDTTPDAQPTTELTLMADPGHAFLVQLGRDRFVVEPNAPVRLRRSSGTHPMTIRNKNGTVIWVNGTLDLAGTSEVTIQLMEGKSPQIAGDASLLGSTAP